jgi:hypothetical protein
MPARVRQQSSSQHCRVAPQPGGVDIRCAQQQEQLRCLLFWGEGLCYKWILSPLNGTLHFYNRPIVLLELQFCALGMSISQAACFPAAHTDKTGSPRCHSRSVVCATRSWCAQQGMRLRRQLCNQQMVQHHVTVCHVLWMLLLLLLLLCCMRWVWLQAIRRVTYVCGT